MFWAFCVYVEAVSVAPQVLMMQRNRTVERFTGHYVFFLGMARFFSCAHWLLQMVDERNTQLWAVCCPTHAASRRFHNLSSKAVPRLCVADMRPRQAEGKWAVLVLQPAVLACFVHVHSTFSFHILRTYQHCRPEGVQQPTHVPRASALPSASLSRVSSSLRIPERCFDDCTVVSDEWLHC